MKKYKATVDSDTRYEITEKDFEIALSINSYLKQDGKLYGICPKCNGPVRLIGLAKANTAQVPYARHTVGSIPNVAERTPKTDVCYYNKHHIDEDDPEERFKVVTPDSVYLFKTIRDYFDKIIYIIGQFYDIHLTYRMKQDILVYLNKAEVWLYPYANEDNLPWIIMYLYKVMPLFGKYIKKDSDLSKILEKKGVELTQVNDDYYQIGKFKSGKYFNYRYMITKHHVSVDDEDNVSESFEAMVVSDNPDDINHPIVHYKKKIEVNDSYFYNLCHSEKTKNVRNPKLVELAKQIMPKEPEITE